MAYRIYQSLNVIFDLSGPFSHLANPAERKVVIQSALREGGDWFIAERIPLRFTDWVYRNGYRVTEKWKAEKRRVLSGGRALPYIGITPPGGGDAGSLFAKVMNVEKMAVAMQRGCRAKITGTSKGGDIIIKTPYGHPIITPLAEVFKTVAPEEYQMVARVVKRAFDDFLSEAKAKGGRSKKLTIEGASSTWTPRGREYDRRDGAGTISHRR